MYAETNSKRQDRIQGTETYTMVGLAVGVEDSKNLRHLGENFIYRVFQVSEGSSMGDLLT